jgi:transposase-like protein
MCAWLVRGPIYTGVVDSSGETIDFMLSPKRDRVAAKHFLLMALWRTVQVRPRVVNIDGHVSYPPIADLKTVTTQAATADAAHVPI